MATMRSRPAGEKPSRIDARAASVASPWAPPCARQPPADFDFLSSSERLQTAKTDHLAICFVQQPPETESALRVSRDLPADQFMDSFVGPRPAVRDVAHHLGILGDGLELLPIVGAPGQKAQALGFEVDHVSHFDR
jgi:hypothetical protein